MRIYISGQITDNPDYKGQFQAAEEYLKYKYPECKIVNPAKLSEVYQNGNYDEYMDICLEMLGKSDYIHLLKGWKKSKGACIEYGFSKALDIEVIY